MAIHQYYLSPCNRQYSEKKQESGKDNPNGYSEYVCQGNTILTGRWHKGDENGKTQYEYAELELVDENGNKVIEPDLKIIVGEPVWQEHIKESSGKAFKSTDNQVIVGRRHYGDENGDTEYATATVTLKRGSNNPTVTLVDCYWSTPIKESDGKWFKADAGCVMVGRKHTGDENGDTMYMSGRLEIDCDEVNKEFFAYRVNNVEKEFKNLPQDGFLETFEHLMYFSNIAVEHIQGYTQYQHGTETYYIFTHNTAGDYGYIMITTETDCTNETIIRMPKGCNHPAGIQCVGKFLFVPCEQDEKCTILVYDLLNLKPMGKEKYIEEKPVKEMKYKHRAGCVGITDYVRNGKHYYLMVLGANEMYHVYRAEIKEDELKNDFASIDFEELNSFKLNSVEIEELQDDGSTKKETRKIDCQGIGLVTDAANEAVYMVAPITWKNYCDWLYLFKLDISTAKGDAVSATPMLGRHMTSHGGLAGLDGIHFRWGAGIYVKANNRLMVLTTAQGTWPPHDANLKTNFWCANK